MQDFLYGTVFIICLFLLVIVCQDAFSGVFEFMLFNGHENAYALRQTYRKLPFFKRYFMLTVFDAEVIKDCKRKSLPEKLFFADIAYLLISSLMLVSKSCFLVLKIHKYDLVYIIYFVLLVSLYIGYTVYSIRWDKTHKGTGNADKEN
ncbi:MAG: hypothetical protein IKK85_08080 [Clostridia bacterium]|nr:hypothetical protein [Clostridia bacterium]